MRPLAPRLRKLDLPLALGVALTVLVGAGSNRTGASCAECEASGVAWEPPARDAETGRNTGASTATVGSSNRARRGTSVANASRSRDTT